MSKPKPTTVRLSEDQKAALSNLAEQSHHSTNGLIGLAVDSLIDFVKRNGKLPLARKQAQPKAKPTHGSKH